MFGLNLLLSVLILSFTQEPIYATAKATISNTENELYEMIMDYRAKKGLKKIPLSNALTVVAQAHCKDLTEQQPDLRKRCNAHSWSDQGSWKSCCYTPDHKTASCMWDKPKELTSYKSEGFEIAAGSSEPTYSEFIMTPEYALSSWKKSTHHNNVILNKGIWKSANWNAIGIGIKGGFACVWFGKITDPSGEPNRSTN